MSEPKSLADYRASRCGHNFEIFTCPYGGCVTRELYEALACLIDEIETDGGVDTSEWPLLDAGRAALAKARGETP